MSSAHSRVPWKFVVLGLAGAAMLIAAVVIVRPSRVPASSETHGANHDGANPESPPTRSATATDGLFVTEMEKSLRAEAHDQPSLTPRTPSKATAPPKATAPGGKRPSGAGVESRTIAFMKALADIEAETKSKISNLERTRRGPTFGEIMTHKFESIGALDADGVDPRLPAFHRRMLDLVRRCDAAAAEYRSLLTVARGVDLGLQMREFLRGGEVTAPKAQAELLKRYSKTILENTVLQQELEAEWAEIQTSWRLDDGGNAWELTEILGRDTFAPLTVDLLVRSLGAPGRTPVDLARTLNFIGRAVTAKSDYVAALEAPLAKHAIVMEDDGSMLLRLDLYLVDHHLGLSTAGVDPRAVAYVQSEITIHQDSIKSQLAEIAVAAALLSRGSKLSMAELIGGVLGGEAVRMSAATLQQRLEASKELLVALVKALCREHPSEEKAIWDAASGKVRSRW